MNQGRIWCVVSPNVGLPLLLGSVAVTSLIVHGVIMRNTTWYSNYYQGSARARVSDATPAGQSKAVAQNSAAGVTVTVKPSPTDATAFVVTVSPPATATATAVPDGAAKPPGALALAAPSR